MLSILLLAGVGVAANIAFLPGDAFFPVSKAIEHEGELELVIQTRTALLCGTIGFKRLIVTDITPEDIARIHAAQDAAAADSAERMEGYTRTTRAHLLIYPRTVALDAIELGKRYNENWRGALSELGASEKYLRQDLTVVVGSSYDLEVPALETITSSTTQAGEALEIPFDQIQVLVVPTELPPVVDLHPKRFSLLGAIDLDARGWGGITTVWRITDEVEVVALTPFCEPWDVQDVCASSNTVD